MYHFEFVAKSEYKEVKKKLISLINEVQVLLKDEFTVDFRFVGSASRNLITRDPKTNIGFDFDVNLWPNVDSTEYSAKELRQLFKKAIDKVVARYGYAPAEDSTRVLTIKVKDVENSRILHSCDFCIVKDYQDDDGYWHQKYIRLNKVDGHYIWNQQPEGYCYLQERLDWLKDNGLWEELKDSYLNKKNNNKVKEKHSLQLLVEATNELCINNGYFEDESDDDDYYDD